MTRPLVDQVAGAVMYEGYILYPYRPGIKNHHRWTFGGLLPRAYCEANGGSDKWRMQTQCLLRPPREADQLNVRVRFLHVVRRIVMKAAQPFRDWQERASVAMTSVESLEVGGRRLHSWQEAIEREVTVDDAPVAEVARRPLRVPFTFPGARDMEPLRDEGGFHRGAIVRERQPIAGVVELSAENLDAGAYRITAIVTNKSELEGRADLPRSEAMLHGCASTHIVLEAPAGGFVSLVDPPKTLRAHADTCSNEGCWPVLVGDDGATTAMLAAPIILYDYPRIAPQSPGDLFDATEIDEILSLRILTLTDEERRIAGDVDDRVSDMLERTSSLTPEQRTKLHGTMQSSAKQRAANSNGRHARDAQPPRSVHVAGVELKPGDRVRLDPKRSADAFDIVLRGRIATIAAIEQDFENRIHIAVTIDDDPGADFGRDGQPGHRFFFSPDDVIPLATTGGTV